jgi:hypothetical protein
MIQFNASAEENPFPPTGTAAVYWRLEGSTTGQSRGEIMVRIKRIPHLAAAKRDCRTVFRFEDATVGGR